MTKVKFEIEIDSSKPSHTDALNSFLKVVGGQEEKETSTVQEAETPAAEEPAKKPRKSRAKKAEPKEEAETPAAEEPKESDEQKLIAVRALLSTKIQEGGDEARDKCVDKLQELGAKNPDTGKYNISSLDPSKYDDFTEFLNSL